MLTRRDWLRLATSSAAAMVAVRTLASPADALAAVSDASAATDKVTVYKSATCGCCKLWVEHMKQNGFTVETHDLDDAKLEETKDTFGVPKALRSCHVALVGPYAIEGHVPADLVKKALRERPKMVGLAVPGMVAGSPGMEVGKIKNPYDVLAFDRSGKSWVYAHR